MKKSQIYKWQLILAVFGIIVSGYLTVTHYLNVPVVCPASQLVDCASVLNSSYSVVFGIPVAVTGLVWFILYLIILIVLKNNEYLLYWNILGFITLIYLWYGEFMLKKICLWCTLVHVIVILLLALTYLYDKSS